MTLYFSNPGEFDIRLLSTFGVSAKPGSLNPIGKFGTGLKNAVAGVLRLGGTVTIHSGEADWIIFAKKDSFRGQDHEMVYCQHGESQEPTALSFSTSLGSHWEPWMIYREFFGNMLDEGGQGLPTTSYPSTEGVVFCITCPPVEEVLHKHHHYFLMTEPLATLGNMEIHPGSSCRVFYRGILVYTAEKPFLYTYNFLSDLLLTEDRTVPEWSIRSNMVSALASHATLADAELVKTILEAKESFKEESLDFSYVYSASDAFKQILLASVRQGKANRTAVTYGRSYLDEVGYKTELMSSEQKALLGEVLAKVTSLLSLAHNLPSPLTFISSEVEEPSNVVDFRGDLYFAPTAFKNHSTLFSACIHGYCDILSDGMTENLISVLAAIAWPKEQSLDEVLAGDKIPF